MGEGASRSFDVLAKSITLAGIWRIQIWRPLFRDGRGLFVFIHYYSWDSDSDSIDWLVAWSLACCTDKLCLLYERKNMLITTWCGNHCICDERVAALLCLGNLCKRHCIYVIASSLIGQSVFGHPENSFTNFYVYIAAVSFILKHSRIQNLELLYSNELSHRINPHINHYSTETAHYQLAP